VDRGTVFSKVQRCLLNREDWGIKKRPTEEKSRNVLGVATGDNKNRGTNRYGHGGNNDRGGNGQGGKRQRLNTHSVKPEEGSVIKQTRPVNRNHGEDGPTIGTFW